MGLTRANTSSLWALETCATSMELEKIKTTAQISASVNRMRRAMTQGLIFSCGMNWVLLFVCSRSGPETAAPRPPEKAGETVQLRIGREGRPR